MSAALHLSLEEFLARPDREDDQREELIEGELILSPGAKIGHALIVTRLREELAPLKQAAYLLINDFSCLLGDRSMPVPDLAAVAWSRAAEAEKNDGWLVGSPELVIEVSSPSNRKLNRKAEIYLEHGAEQVWIVYPKTKGVLVVTAEGSSEARVGGTLDFKGVQVEVAAIFPTV